MKKLILILLVLTVTATNAYTEDIFTDEAEDIPLELTLDIPVDVPADVPAVTTTEDSTTNTASDIIQNIPESSNKTEKTDLVDKVSQINSLSDDEQKIKEWTKLKSTGNYIIINKKDCSATIYNNDGDEIQSFEIGVGRDKGDDFNDTSGLVGKSKNTTPAGEFTLKTNIFNKAAYGDLTLSLGKEANKSQKSKKVVALHKIPKFRMEDRFKKFYDGNLANNRMSHGCINFVEKDFKELTKYIHGGLKAYILPEESDNHLILKKNEKGEFEFVQTKY